MEEIIITTVIIFQIIYKYKKHIIIDRKYKYIFKYISIEIVCIFYICQIKI